MPDSVCLTRATRPVYYHRGPVEAGRSFSILHRRLRMAIVVNKDECTACGICADVCPVEAITVDEVAEIDPDVCTECGTCIEECPVEAISEE